MKILLDMNLSPLWVPFLEAGGYEVKYWTEIGAITAPDIEIMEWARSVTVHSPPDFLHQSA